MTSIRDIKVRKKSEFLFHPTEYFAHFPELLTLKSLLKIKLNEFTPTIGIIKEEELERMDQIVEGMDGWVQDDEIDYNQKLVFSDDDTETQPPPTRGKDAKRVNFNDRDKETKSSSRKDDQESRSGKFESAFAIT